MEPPGQARRRLGSLLGERSTRSRTTRAAARSRRRRAPGPCRSSWATRRTGELSLSPSYQRADVWPTTTAQQLIESILRGIPLPSVILLQRTLSQRVMYETVDGKQRLTSILRFVGRHPRALDLVREKEEAWGHAGLVQVFQTDYPQFKKLWRANESQTLTRRSGKGVLLPVSAQDR